MTDQQTTPDGNGPGVDSPKPLVNDDLKAAIAARDAEKAKRRELEKQIEELAAFKAKAEEEKLTEQERINNRIKELEAKASKVDAYESAVAETLETKLAAIPEERRSLIPDVLSPADKLRYIAKNEAFLIGTPKVQVAPGMLAGTPPASPPPPPAGSLTEAEKKMARVFGMTDEEYIASKKATVRAKREDSDKV